MLGDEIFLTQVIDILLKIGRISFGGCFMKFLKLFTMFLVVSFFSGSLFAKDWERYLPKNPQTRSDFKDDRFFIGNRKDTSNGGLYYDKKGSYVGRSKTSGETTQFYNSTGAYKGYSRTAHDKTTYFDETGNYNGYSVSDGVETRHYDEMGKYEGYSVNGDTTDLQFKTSDGYKGQQLNLQ